MPLAKRNALAAAFCGSSREERAFLASDANAKLRLHLLSPCNRRLFPRPAGFLGVPLTVRTKRNETKKKKKKKKRKKPRIITGRLFPIRSSRLESFDFMPRMEKIVRVTATCLPSVAACFVVQWCMIQYIAVVIIFLFLFRSPRLLRNPLIALLRKPACNNVPGNDLPDVNRSKTAFLSDGKFQGFRDERNAERIGRRVARDGSPLTNRPSRAACNLPGIGNGSWPLTGNSRQVISKLLPQQSDLYVTTSVSLCELASQGSANVARHRVEELCRRVARLR